MKIAYILLSVLLGAAGQLLFKSAVVGRGTISFFNAAKYSLFSVYFWVGLSAYAVSLMLWMKILADTDLSYARPFAGAGYVVTALAAAVFFGERISIDRWMGIMFIIIGIFIVARS